MIRYLQNPAGYGFRACRRPSSVHVHTVPMSGITMSGHFRATNPLITNDLLTLLSCTSHVGPGYEGQILHRACHDQTQYLNGNRAATGATSPPAYTTFSAGLPMQ